VIFGSLRFFIVTHTVFSSVGVEMLTGGSVVVGWDQIERAGPKDDRQVTGGIERWSKINMEEQHCEIEKSLPESIVSDFLTRWYILCMMEQDRQVTRPDIVIDMDYIAQTIHTHVVQPAPTSFRLTATTATADDPRSSSSTTYSTDFSGYVPGGLNTVLSPAVDAPWTSVSTSYTPYDLCTNHFLSLRVIKDTPTTATPPSSDSGRNTHTPTSATSQSSVSERNTSPTITCPSQDGSHVRHKTELDSSATV
jgi:hypothetical protein